MTRAADTVQVFELQLDARLELPGEAPQQLAATVWVPPVLPPNPVLLLCLPGGNMNRRYYDLHPPDDREDESFSFASQMCARGHVVAALDHLGLGDSTRPDDGWQLTPDVLAQANAAATAEIHALLREGRLDAAVPALPGLRSVGVGHSMGAMMTILQQHDARSHDALVLLGFSTRGLPEYLPPAVREGGTDVAHLRPQIVDLARKMFGQPYPIIHRNGSDNTELFGSRKADPRGVKALKAATDCVLPVPAMLSMLPDNVLAEARTIDVPVFLGLGERDMVGPTHAVPASFSGSMDVTLQILPEAGHSHFLFASRELLFARLDYWLHGTCP